MRRPILALVLVILALGLPAGAAVIEITPSDNFETACESLGPGDELIVHGGTYSFSGRLSLTQAATEDSPIVIRAADGETPVITRDALQNIINIEGASWITIRGLELTGGGDGIKIADSSYCTLYDNHIHHVGGVGINFKPGTSHHFVVEHNQIHHTAGTGEGMYIGCNDSACIVHSSQFIYNWVHHTAGDQGDGIELKQGSWGNTIAHNVVHDTNYPCIIIYGTDGNDRNVVTGNFLIRCGDSGIQAAAEALVSNNIVLDSPANGINSHDHQCSTVNLEVVHNTVIDASPCMRLTDWGGRTGMVLANNAIYCPGGTAIRFASGSGSVGIAGNVILGSVEGATSGWIDGSSIAADFTDHAAMNVWPTAASTVLGAAANAQAVAVDFNGTARTSPHDVGAYHRTGDTNPGWTPGEGFKDEVVPVPDADETPEAVEPAPDAAADAPADTSADVPPADVSDDGPHDPPDEGQGDGGEDSGCGCVIVQ
ncbi:MAG: right-handed parallel beta-helix repeat-containing protein [Deltaproteobacteria bacterium]|nr:right-handed parallel beta-helix repeat-containing protein [Deltaproteobacteria bacterium]